MVALGFPGGSLGDPLGLGGSLSGVLGGVGSPQDPPGRPWGSLGVSLGGPEGSSGSAHEAPNTQKVVSGCLVGEAGSPLE